MKPLIVELHGSDLNGEAAFHDTFARVFGFLDGYGRNMDAWIDCMSCLRDMEPRMTKIHVRPTETLTLLIRDHQAMRDGAPRQWADLVECAAFVNFREIERGDWPVLALAFA